MHNEKLHFSQYPAHSSRIGKGLFTALCATTAAVAGGVLVSRFVNRKPKAPSPDPAGETDLEEIRESLMRIISHDLRTPLSGIMGNSLLYLESVGTLDDTEKLQLVNHIHEDSSWLLNIVDNLLAIARIRDRDHAVCTREEIVEEILGETLQKMETRHPDFKICVAIPEQIIMLPMDALLIEQVLINLLENAFLHSESTDPVDIIVEDGEEDVTFIVRDYGQGIPEDMLGHLFDSPSLADKASNSRQKTGIGLLICKAVISAHHGTLTARNHSLGAEFIFTLPKKAR